MILTMLSVPSSVPQLRLCALVPGHEFEAVERLRNDDPIWRDNEITVHWAMSVQTEQARLRPRIKFWVA